MKQLVSILIPAYNAEKWIAECIESAISQTWPWKEIIVVDDGSKDRTFEIARKYSSSFVKVVTQENRGASAARNKALSLAQGDYIQWLDADDLLAPNKIEKQLEFSENGKVSRILLSGAWGQFYYSPKRARFYPNALWEDLEPVEWLFRKIDQNLWMAIESWLVSRKLTEMAGPWDENLSFDDDGEYFCRVLSCSHGVRFLSDARCFCRKGHLSYSHELTLTEIKRESLLASLFLYIQRLRSMEDSPRTRSACIKLLDRWTIYFYPERMDLYQKMQSTVAELSGRLDPPKLRWKYRWLQSVFGWRVAKKAQYALPAIRYLTIKKWEQFFYRLLLRKSDMK